MIKSPLNYVGGKLAPAQLTFIPERSGRSHDLFGGGFNVGINVAEDTSTMTNCTL